MITELSTLCTRDDLTTVQENQDIFALSELLGAAMTAAEESVLPVERQAWETLQRQVFEVQTVKELERSLRKQLAMVPCGTYSAVCRYALTHVTSVFEPRAI